MSFVGDLIGGFLGSGAASSAAKVQQQGAQQALGISQQNQASANAAQQQATQQQTANAQPYLNLGSGGATSLASLLAPGGQLTQGFGAFDPNSVNPNSDPGYAFQQQQGLAALQNSAAARGGLLSTGTAKNLLGFSQGLASTEYQNAYNRALQSYQTNQNNFNTNNNNVYSRLMGAAGLGQNSSVNLNSNLQQGAQNTGSIDLNAAQQQAQQVNNAAAARASGIIGSANAWSGALGGMFNSLPGSLSLSSLLGRLGGGGGNSGGFIGGTNGNPYFDEGTDF